MKLVEECAGTGQVTWRGETYAPVPYAISRFQAMTRGGLPVPGLHRIEGRLGLDALGAGGDLADASVSLRLEDGRTLSLTVVDGTGRVVAEGHGPTKCTCC